jgi:hypothetical protein
VPGVPSDQRFAEYIRRVMGLREATSLHLIEDLMPVVPVLDPTAPEHALARRERRYAFSTTQAAPGVGNFAHVILEVPTSHPNALVVVERVYVMLGGGPFRMTLQVGLTGGGSLAQNLDLRGGPSGAFSGPRSMAQFIAGFTAALLGNFHWRSLITPVVDHPPVVLTAGTSLRVANETANDALTVAMVFRERAVNSDELNPTGA